MIRGTGDPATRTGAIGRVVLVAAAILVSPRAAEGQRLRDRVAELFTFGDCGRPLCLDGSINAANGHGDHFIPDVISGTSTLIGFLTSAIAGSAGSIPLAASSSGPTFKFVNGLPVQTSTSTGAIFGERAQTMGRGRFLLGANLIGLNFKTLRGTPLDQLVFNLAHQDVTPAGLGDPVLENELIEVRMSLEMDLLVSTFFATYGLTDRLDLGLAVPLVHTSLQGRSTARVVPFGPTPAHFFTGTPSNPGLRASTATFGSATGIGDIALRLKGNVHSGDRLALAIMGDARLPTGDERDLLGSGGFSLRTQALASVRFGDFAPHLNLGYLVAGGSERADAVLATVGFDQPLGSWATIALDVLSEWEVGESRLRLPGPIQYQLPFPRSVAPTNIADRKDHRVIGSVGFKFQTRGGPIIVTSGLIPLRPGGLQPYAGWTLGLEFTF
jgi:hypothetical protein